jgi:ATP synthase F1 delta subunit
MIISGVPVAKKYATAYLNVYEDELTGADVHAMLVAYTFFKSHHEFMHLLCAVSIDKAETILVFTKLINDFALPKSLNMLMVLLVKHKRVCYLKEVLQDIYCLYKMRKNILELEIKTADSIDAHTAQAFQMFFAQESGKKIESKVSVDRSLIAGVRLQSEFFLWEYSVASRVRALRHKLVIEG